MLWLGGLIWWNERGDLWIEVCFLLMVILCCLEILVIMLDLGWLRFSKFYVSCLLIVVLRLGIGGAKCLVAFMFS